MMVQSSHASLTLVAREKWKLLPGSGDFFAEEGSFIEAKNPRNQEPMNP
jgi:hypothetical protein